LLVIHSFRCRETAKLFVRQPSRKFPAGLQRAALRKLFMLDAATRLDDLRVPPSNRLEKLRGSRAGQYSIRVNDQWKICFAWRDEGAWDVEIVDYH
jgi:proteic killer suppression protein